MMPELGVCQEFNSRKSVTWSVVPSAPLVESYVRLVLMEPSLACNAIISLKCHCRLKMLLSDYNAIVDL